AQADLFGARITHVTPDRGRVRESSERYAQELLRNASRSLDHLAVFGWHLAIASLIDDQPAAQIRVLVRQIMDEADRLQPRAKRLVESDEVARVVRRIAMESPTKQIADEEFGLRNLLDANDVVDRRGHPVRRR